MVENFKNCTLYIFEELGRLAQTKQDLNEAN